MMAYIGNGTISKIMPLRPSYHRHQAACEHFGMRQIVHTQPPLKDMVPRDNHRLGSCLAAILARTDTDLYVYDLTNIQFELLT